MSQLDNREEQAEFLGYDYGVVPAISGDGGLHAAVAELVRNIGVETRPHPEAVIEQFAALATSYIRGAAQASVMLVSHKGAIRSSAATGSYPHLIDTIQEEMLEGPGLESAFDHRTIRVDDFAEEARWPRFTQAVLAETPVRSMLCFQLYTHVQNWGTLTLHSDEAYAFDTDAEEAGAILATHAALTLQAVQRGRQFRSALGSRDIIGQAKGILMERYDIGAGAAFSLLTRISQESNKPVVVIAKELVETKPGAKK
jgi:GAF domain-containing protein